MTPSAGCIKPGQNPGSVGSLWGNCLSVSVQPVVCHPTALLRGGDVETFKLSKQKHFFPQRAWSLPRLYLILFIFQWRNVSLIPVSVFLWHFKHLLLGGLLELRCWPLASTILVFPSLAQKRACWRAPDFISTWVTAFCWPATFPPGTASGTYYLLDAGLPGLMLGCLAYPLQWERLTHCTMDGWPAESGAKVFFYEHQF